MYWTREPSDYKPKHIIFENDEEMYVIESALRYSLSGQLHTPPSREIIERMIQILNF